MSRWDWLLPPFWEYFWPVRHRRQPEAVPPATAPPGSSALSALLDALEEIAEDHAELFDTDVREHMWECVERRFIRLQADYQIPAEFGMFSDEANARLRAALEHHLGNFTAVSRALDLDTEAAWPRMLER